MDIGGWLRSLGLERYEAAFRENAIDADVLRDLTDQDLESARAFAGPISADLSAMRLTSASKNDERSHAGVALATQNTSSSFTLDQGPRA